MSVLAFTACGEDNAENADNNNATAVAASDKSILESNGYTVIYSAAGDYGFENVESGLKAEAGSMSGYISATKNSGDGDMVVITVYYFKTEAYANAWYDKQTYKEAFVKSGVKIVTGDTEKLITK